MPPVARDPSDEFDPLDDDAVHSVALPPALVVPVAHASHAPSFRYWLVVHDGVTADFFL